MLVVNCPRVRTGRGERLVTERRIVGMDGAGGGFLLTVACPCGERHEVHIGRRPDEDVA